MSVWDALVTRVGALAALSVGSRNSRRPQIGVPSDFALNEKRPALRWGRPLCVGMAGR